MYLNNKMKKQNTSLFITQPSLAPLDEFVNILSPAYSSGILTHNGPLVQKLENELCKKLGIKNLVSVVNGTIALQMPLKALQLKGEIITTPFSWIATCSSILWERCRPVFVDVDPKTFNLDPSKIEDAITFRTEGIMPVHVFSNPCDTDAIDVLSKKYGLKVIYDAAHAMFTNYKGKSLLEYGDVSATSFHATKLFNTGEGGACITTNIELHEQLKRIRFFGHNENKEVVEDGFNGKMTEIHAALGLANLEIMDRVLYRRKEIFELYYDKLSDLDFITFQLIDKSSYNFSYMPLVFSSEEHLHNVEKELNKHNIFPRRYFYPSLNTLKVVSQYSLMPNSERLAQRILCLPSYTKLSDENIDHICSLIKNCFNSK